jgi:hypothetical protein
MMFSDRLLGGSVTAPLAPVVDGSIYAVPDILILVDNVLPDARVKVLQDGAEIGHATLRRGVLYGRHRDKMLRTCAVTKCPRIGGAIVSRAAQRDFLLCHGVSRHCVTGFVTDVFYQCAGQIWSAPPATLR